MKPTCSQTTISTLKQCWVVAQVLKAEAHTSTPSVLRWFNTIAYLPHVAEYIGPVTVLPAADPTSSSSSATPPPANGHPSGGVSRGVPGLIAAAAASSSSSAGASAASQEAAGQEKPKGKAAKGGKLALNDVAKGQKKKGRDKEKPSQNPKAPQGQGMQGMLHRFSACKFSNSLVSKHKLLYVH